MLFLCLGVHPNLASAALSPRHLLVVLRLLPPVLAAHLHNVISPSAVKCAFIPVHAALPGHSTLGF